MKVRFVASRVSRLVAFPILASVLGLAACDPGVAVPEDYAFESRFAPGTSSVEHGDATARHVLIDDLTDYVEGLTDAVDSGAGSFGDGVASGEVMTQLEYYFESDASLRASDPIRLTTDPPALQTTYGELSASATLLDALAGESRATDHADFSTHFVGFSDPAIAAHGGGIDSPANLVRAMFATLEANAIARATDPTSRMSPVADPAPLPIEVTENGIMIAELLPKFLMGAVAFAQATDAHLDDDVEGHGLLADGAADQGGYTALEHEWDMAYGYFGAAADYSGYTHSDIAGGTVARDSDGDGRIDLLTERNFAPAGYAARRDHGSVVPTDFMGEIGLAFRTGRAILASAGGPLTDAQRADLRAQRDLVVARWEAVFAANVIHYLNDVLALVGEELDHEGFLELAGAWSEMKGFALAFQFNPRSALSADDFAHLHALLGDAPVLADHADPTPAEYRADLLEARAMLGAAFGFDAANLGDDTGANGW